MKKKILFFHDYVYSYCLTKIKFYATQHYIYGIVYCFSL